MAGAAWLGVEVADATLTIAGDAASRPASSATTAVSRTRRVIPRRVAHAPPINSADDTAPVSTSRIHHFAPQLSAVSAAWISAAGTLPVNQNESNGLGRADRPDRRSGS